MPDFISEDQIEQALLQKLQHLHGFDSLNLPDSYVRIVFLEKCGSVFDLILNHAARD